MYKRIFLLTALCLGLFSYAHAQAATFSCSSIDGALVFGQDAPGGGYEFIGAISSKYDSNSIADAYGKGNKYSIDSIFDTYGHYGTKYGTYSANNNMALYPPFLVDPDSYQFLAYLTTNRSFQYKVSRWTALMCANKSYTTANWNY